MRRMLFCLPLLAAACAATSAERVTVLRSLEGRQCESGGLTLADLEKRLAAAGVKAAAGRCASDGRMRPQMCGAPDGRLGLFEIDAADRAKALAAGFQLPPAGDAPVVQPCR